MVTRIVNLVHDVGATRRAFENWLKVGVVAGVGAPSRLPPRGGWPWLAKRRLTFKTRLGPVLETEIGNAAPIIEIFRDSEYDLPVDWRSVRRVLDVGGHIGAFAAWVVTQAPHAQIVSFEPDPRNFRELEKNIARNRIFDRVIPVNAALGASEGRRSLHLSSHADVSSFTASAGTQPTDVKCLAFDSYLRQQGDEPFDLLKLDCEGAEWEILESVSAESLQEIQHLLVECHMNEADEVNAMMQLLVDLSFVPHVQATSLGGGPYPHVAILWAARP